MFSAYIPYQFSILEVADPKYLMFIPHNLKILHYKISKGKNYRVFEWNKKIMFSPSLSTTNVNAAEHTACEFQWTDLNWPEHVLLCNIKNIMKMKNAWIITMF